MSEKKSSGKMWGGRFQQGTARAVEDFTCSVHFDSRLYRHDIRGSRAHARMLARQGLISDTDCAAIITGLDAISAEIDNGSFEFKRELEDIHMNIEKALSDRIGDAGARLHTARSRNDQVALDLRLYLRDQCDCFEQLLQDIRRALVELARNNFGLIIPGYTHMQRAQPVLVSHHLLAYYEMFGRDRERIGDCRKRTNVMPLGSAAMAGTGLPIDRKSVAEELEFTAISRNSMDSVADRDFAAEFLFCCALIQTHLSRLSEELVIWASDEFGFVDIADSFCTGSSIMPQKKNPDIPEIVRGKSGRVLGNLVSLLTTLKGLPMTYNRDLQEDKEPVFDSVDTVSACLEISADLLHNLKFNHGRLAAAVHGGGFMTATDLADYLVTRDIPFRRAHEITGQVVAHCLNRGIDLKDMDLAELKKFAPGIDAGVFERLSVEGSVASRVSAGGTANIRVEEALARAEEELGI